MFRIFRSIYLPMAGSAPAAIFILILFRAAQRFFSRGLALGQF